MEKNQHNKKFHNLYTSADANGGGLYVGKGGQSYQDLLTLEDKGVMFLRNVGIY
jgi:hypothetical protein